MDRYIMQRNQWEVIHARNRFTLTPFRMNILEIWLINRISGRMESRCMKYLEINPFIVSISKMDVKSWNWKRDFSINLDSLSLKFLICYSDQYFFESALNFRENCWNRDIGELRENESCNSWNKFKDIKCSKFNSSFNTIDKLSRKLNKIVSRRLKSKFII